jgi:hypothetical protein
MLHRRPSSPKNVQNTRQFAASLISRLVIPEKIKYKIIVKTQVDKNYSTLSRDKTTKGMHEKWHTRGATLLTGNVEPTSFYFIMQ